MDQAEYDAINQLKTMSDVELEMVQHTVVKWCCQGKRCRGFTKVRDYGIAPEYWHPRKSIRWVSLSEKFWMCAKHYKIYKRLIKNYPRWHVQEKLFDPNKIKIINP